MELDSFDIRILTALQKNGALTNNVLAQKVGLSASQCSRRRVALENDGIIQKYVAQLDRLKLGFTLHVFIRVSLRNQTKEDSAAFTRWTELQPEIMSAFSISGDADYLLEVYTKDLEQFSDFLHERLLPQSQVNSVRSEFVLKSLKTSRVLPI